MAHCRSLAELPSASWTSLGESEAATSLAGSVSLAPGENGAVWHFRFYDSTDPVGKVRIDANSGRVIWR